MNSKVSSFADDTRVSRSIHNSTNVGTLQTDLDKIYAWQDKNNMQFNEGKFELLKYGRNQELKSDSKYTSASGQPILEKTNVKDLGITMSNTASFEEHIDKLITKSRQICGWISRTFKSRD